MKDNEKNIENSMEIVEKKREFFQIDLLKAFMIAFVILDHAMAYTYRPGIGLQLWERMAIPMFLIILGFNMGKSFARKGEQSLKELYSWDYFKKKIWRYIFPYIILYIGSTLVGLIIYEKNFPNTFSENWILEFVIFQKTLLEGPGNWFIPVLFQSIIVVPLLYKLFSKWPKLTLTACFIIELCMHLFLFFYIGPRTSYDDFQRELYFRQTILFYMFAIVLGMWFSQNHDLFNKKNLFVWGIFPISLIYMIAWDFFDFRLEIDGNWLIRGDYNFFTFFYSALIFLIVMRLIPKNPKNRIAKAFSVLGKATFHIYLIQDVYYITLYINYNSVWTAPDFSGFVNVLGIASNDILVNFGLLAINWIICFSIGVIWWFIEKKVINLILKN